MTSRFQNTTAIPEVFKILERIADAIVAIDNNWCYTYMNKKAGEILNCDPQQMTGKNIWTEFPESFDQSLQLAYERAMKEQKYCYLEKYYPTNDRWFENHIYPSPEGLFIFFRDITEKKKTEEKLALSQKRFRALVENNEGIISLVDEKLNVLFRSESAARITGWTNEEFEKTNAAEYIHPDDLEGLKSTMTKAMQKAGENIPIEIRVRHKKGNYIWLEGVVKNMMHDPAIGGIITNMRDITEKKKTEEELNKNHAFIESIINASPDIIYIYDIEERKNVFSNDGLQTNLGYTIAEIKEMGDQILPTLMPKEDFDDYLKNIYPRYNTLKDKEILTHEFRMKHKTGSWHWFFTKESIFLRNPDGTPKQIFGVTTDITEQKKADEKLQKSEELFSTAFHTSPAGILIARIADGKIINANDAFLHMFEFSREEVIGHNSIELNMLSRGEREKLIQQQIASGGLTDFELLSKTKSGKPIYILFSSKPLEVNGEICHITTLIDITERKKAEEALKESNLALSEAHRIAKIGSWTYYFTGELKWSDNLYHLYGLPSKISDTTPHFFFQLVHPDDRQKMQQWMQACLAGDAPGEYEFRSILPDDSIHYYQGSGEVKYDTENNPVYMRGTVQDITERKKTEEEIIQTTEQLGQLAAHLQIIREEERKRIGREIHDELGQQLTAIKMDLVWIDKKTNEDAILIKGKLKNSISLLDDSNLSIRKILNELRMGVLEHQQLSDAMLMYAEQFTNNTGIAVQLSEVDGQLQADDAVSACLFRVFQESLTNVARYAEAKQITVKLCDDENSIYLSVEDDGKGFDISTLKNKNSFGILGMRERVAFLNGGFDLQTSPGKGTRIDVSIPKT